MKSCIKNTPFLFYDCLIKKFLAALFKKKPMTSASGQASQRCWPYLAVRGQRRRQTTYLLSFCLHYHFVWIFDISDKSENKNINFVQFFDLGEPPFFWKKKSKKPSFFLVSCVAEIFPCVSKVKGSVEPFSAACK